MTRPIRIEYPGAFYHLFSRGIEKRDIFRDSRDYRLFLSLLGHAHDRFSFAYHAYALMPNHYHLLLETPVACLSRGMQFINSSYSLSFNSRHDRVGHLFQGRFKALLVHKDSYLSSLTQYIHFNPVRAGLTRLPEEYPWSSYRSLLGLAPRPPWLRPSSLPLEEGPVEDPRRSAVSQSILGPPSFLDAMRPALKAAAKRSRDFDQGSPERLPDPETVLAAAQQYLGMGDRSQPWERSLGKDAAILLLRECTHLKLHEVARLFQVGPSGITMAVRRIRRRLDEDAALRARLEAARLAIGQTLKK